MNDAGNKRAVTLLADTDAAIGGFAATNVAFAGGAASDVALSTQSATTNCILKETFDLTWKAVVSNEIEVVTNVHQRQAAMTNADQSQSKKMRLPVR